MEGLVFLSMWPHNVTSTKPWMSPYHHLHSSREAVCIMSLFNSVSFLLFLIAGAKNNLGAFLLLFNPQIGHFGKFKGILYYNKINKWEFNCPYMCTISNFLFFFNFLFLIEVQLIYNIVLVSGTEHSDSCIQISDSLPLWLLQNTENSSSQCYSRS